MNVSAVITCSPSTYGPILEPQTTIIDASTCHTAAEDVSILNRSVDHKAV